MALYKTGINPSQMAQSAMNAATQAAASQTKQTTTKVKKEGNVWDDIYKGAAAVAAVGKGVNSLVDAAGSAWDMYDQYKLRDAYDAVSKAFAQGGFESIQNNPDMQDYWHTQAVGQFVKDRASTEKGRLEMLKSMDAAADKLYQDWRVQAMTVNKAFKSGDMQQFMPLMEQLAATSPLPYRLEGTQDGKFRVLFRSDQHQGWTATGQVITPQEAMNEVNKVLQGEQSVFRGLDGKLHPVNPGFNAAAARYYWGTVMGNAENRLDPKKQISLYDANGNVVGLGVIQNPVDDYGAQPRLLVFDRRGRQVGAYDGMEGVFQAGMSPYKPAKQKGSGNGGTGQTAGGFKLTDGDRSALRRACTIMDPNSGEERVDHGKVAALENFMQRHGLSADAALAAFDENVAMAMQQGAANLQAAEWAVLAKMMGKPLPQRTNANQAGGSAHAGGQQGVLYGLGERIREAADGKSGAASASAPTSDKTAPSAAGQKGVLASLGDEEQAPLVDRYLGPHGALDNSDMTLAGLGGVQSSFARQERKKQHTALIEEVRERARIRRERERMEMDRELDDFIANPNRYGKAAGIGYWGEATDQARAMEQLRDAWGNPISR